MSSARLNAIGCSSSNDSWPDWGITAMRSGVSAGSTTSGRSPIKPSATAGMLPWPLPVAPSDPNSSTPTRRTEASVPSSASPRANLSAAIIGPTVCELDGPMPILNRSKTLSAISGSYLAVVWIIDRSQRHRYGAKLATDVDLVVAVPDPVGVDDGVVHRAHIGQTHAAADCFAPRRRRHLAGDDAVTQDQFTAPQHGFRRLDAEPDEFASGTLGLGLLDSGAAEEFDVGLQLAREQQPGLDGILARRQLATECAICLLQPHRLDRVIAAAPDPESLTRFHQVLIHADRELGGHVEFPAQFADVGYSGRPHRRVAQRDLPACAE